MDGLARIGARLVVAVGRAMRVAARGAGCGNFAGTDLLTSLHLAETELKNYVFFFFSVRSLLGSVPGASHSDGWAPLGAHAKYVGIPTCTASTTCRSTCTGRNAYVHADYP